MSTTNGAASSGSQASDFLAFCSLEIFSLAAGPACIVSIAPVRILKQLSFQAGCGTIGELVQTVVRYEITARIIAPRRASIHV